MLSRPDLNARVRDAMGRAVPGVALIVVGREGVRARSAVGTADLARGSPMGTDLAVPWFSMTKIVTATVTTRLVERGVLDLDARVQPLVPAVATLRPSEWAGRITVRHLLQHASGLRTRCRCGGSTRRIDPGRTRTPSFRGCSARTTNYASSRERALATPTSGPSYWAPRSAPSWAGRTSMSLVRRSWDRSGWRTRGSRSTARLR